MFREQMVGSVNESQEKNYERECFQNLRQFMNAYDTINKARTKKEVAGRESGLAEEVKKLNSWYTLAVRFILENAKSQAKLFSFWDGLQKQIERIDRSRSRYLDFEDIRLNILGQVALHKIISEDRDEVVLVGLDEDEPVAADVSTLELRKVLKQGLKVGRNRETFGLDLRVVEVDGLDTEMPYVSFEEDFPIMMTTVDNSVDSVSNRLQLPEEEQDYGSKKFYIIIEENDFDETSGQPKARVADGIRRQLEGLIE